MRSPLAQKAIREDPDTHRSVVAVKVQGVFSAEQMLFGKATLYSTVYHHHKVRAADTLFKAAVDRMFAIGDGLDGKSFEDPADMIRFVDSDFTQWVHRSPDFVGDPELRDLLGLLSRRELPVRVLELSARSVHEFSLPDSSDSGIRNRQRRDLPRSWG